ncbi:DUF3499 domain-containing protein [Paeniglutamicibacter antarcticus]|uniref:DUF3499 domain-containing protein n=1 Tax=Arthrobacter terrae TaxID=2935737 RepID=A0A931CNV7_9MICC|nr:DUF3499 domain-containing protein [Arthrobacter terrae]MBG0738294.1 DUF3499 domain-containing protein [Arthrobacter terrae]
MGTMRMCSRSGCREAAAATLTYVYADSTAVLGPLATFAEPHCYDLCTLHAGRLSVPRGWEVLRLAMPSTPTGPGPDDLLALVDAVREAAGTPAAEPAALGQRGLKSALEPPAGAATAAPGRRSHLRILRD